MDHRLSLGFGLKLPAVKAPSNKPKRIRPSTRGELNHRAVLTEDDVRAIRAAKELHRDIAKQYGTCKTNVQKIKKRIRWAHVEDLV